MTNMGFNIVSLFHAAAKQHPKRIAIIDKTGSITFEQLQKDVMASAANMQHKGLKAGDRVLVFVPISIALYTHVLALYHIGCTAVFLDEWVSIKRLSLCCRIAKCKGFIGVPLARFIGWFVRDVRTIPIHLGTKMNYSSNSITEPAVIIKESETALITFTTGSTGTPKAAKRTHNFLKEQFDALMEKIEPSQDDVDMPALPIVLLINLGCGVTSVIPDWKSSKPDKMQPEKIWQQVQRHGVNRITSSPYFLKKLAQYVSSNNISSEQIRKMFTGGAPVFPNEAALITQGFAQSKTQIVFGSTEAEPISSIYAYELSDRKEEAEKHGLPVGVPYRKSQVKIILWSDEPIACNNIHELTSLEQPKGALGEIIVSGPHVLREYFNNDEALKRNKIFIDDNCWHRSGDSGFLNDKGELFLTGRCTTLFEHEGKTVKPFLIENTLQQIDGVVLATIMKLNNEIIYFVELSAQEKKEEVKKSIEQIWPKPSLIVFTDKMPRDKRHHSKIEYGVLREMMLRQN